MVSWAKKEARSHDAETQVTKVFKSIIFWLHKESFECSQYPELKKNLWGKCYNASASSGMYYTLLCRKEFAVISCFTFPNQVMSVNSLTFTADRLSKWKGFILVIQMMPNDGATLQILAEVSKRVVSLKACQYRY